MKEYTKEELFKMNAIDVYKIILDDEANKRFPNGFWNGLQGRKNAIMCTKYMIEDILKYNDDMIKEKISIKLFKQFKLNSMLSECFNSDVYEIINTIYPNRFKKWELQSVSTNKNVNDKKYAIESVKWLIEEKLNLSDEELKKQISVKFFKDNGLNKILKYYFNGRPYEAINSVYPNKYKEWEFKNVRKGLWQDKENGIKATKWLIEEKLNLSDDEIKEQLSYKLFKNNGLSGMINEHFNGSPYEIIKVTYPNRFKVWEFKSVPNNYWNDKENGIEATKWLIEEKLKLSDDEIKEQLSCNLFKENGLFGMLERCFNSSPYEAINSVYPNKFKEWEFKNGRKGLWQDKENGIKATKWLIEEKLKLSDKELKEKLSYNLFKDNDLIAMLDKCFNSSPYEAINTVYPDKFKEWEFKSVPNRYWFDEENRIKAIKWLIEDKLKLSDDEIKECLGYKILNKYGLIGMVVKYYSNDISKAINSVYPNKFKKSDFRTYKNKCLID